MDIANIFCQSLGVTSHAKMFLTVCRFWTGLVSICMAWGIRSKKNCHPFEWLGLSVREKLSSIQKAWAIHLKKVDNHSNGLGYQFEKIIIRLKGSGYLFEKEFVVCSSDWSYLFKDKLFQQSFHPQTISLLATRIERSVILQVTYVTNFIDKCIIYE